MTESQRTMAFVVLAVVSLGVALVAAPSKPKAVQGFTDVGELFYADFKPEEAAELNVIAYNPDLAEARIFGVAMKDGKWRIPSRHNYPADGKDRLAKCAASLIGLKRGAAVGLRANEHPEFEVVDPYDEKNESLKRGQRITLKNEKGDVLVDYIIGKQVPGRSGFYYVRRPDEQVTYTAKLALDLSTKFADWIEPDLLKVDGWKLTGVTIDNYSVDTDRGRIVGREQNKLTRKNSGDPWKLDGLDEATEEVNKDEVQKLVDALDNLKIVGVRPKPAKLQRDLKLAEGIKLDQATAIDLQMKGFFFAQGAGGGQQLVSKEGDVIATTDQGVEYLLHFGDVFSGTDEEIEFGFAKSEGDKPAEEKKDGEKPADEKPGAAKKKSRYLFVTAEFNPESLGPKPEEPVKPEDPGEAPASDVPVRGEADPADATVAENVGPLAEYNEKKTIFDALTLKFDADSKKYETDLKAYEEKVKAGEKQAKELNARFADWYYAIAVESFENLRQGRKSLVKPKAPEAPAIEKTN